MELKQNINRVHGDLTNYFENVQISEKSNKELGNYFELSVLENNKEVKAIIKMTEIENANFSWNYYANPLDENSLVERVSSIYTFSSDVQDIFEKNRFSSDYKGINEGNEVITDLGQKILNELDEAIEKFGIYSYQDKGASEIINLEPLEEELNSLSTQEVIDVLKYLLDNHQDSKRLVEELISSLDQREDFDDILDGDERFEY